MYEFCLIIFLCFRSKITCKKGGGGGYFSNQCWTHQHKHSSLRIPAFVHIQDHAN